MILFINGVTALATLGKNDFHEVFVTPHFYQPTVRPFFFFFYYSGKDLVMRFG